MVSMDLHAGQIQGFLFNVPFDHLYAMPVFLECLTVVSEMSGQSSFPLMQEAWNEPCVRNDSALTKIIDKRRQKANVSEVMHIIGEIEGRKCILLDDMIDTAGTLCGAADALIAHGAKKVIAAATHAVLSGPAVERITNSALEEVIVTDTIPLSGGSLAVRIHRSFGCSIAG